MKQEFRISQSSSIYDYDQSIARTYRLIQNELSRENQDLIEKYDKSMIAESLAKATRHKHLQVILNLTRFLGKDWSDVTKEDIDNVVIRIVQEYAGDSGQETNTSYDHKKIPKICNICKQPNAWDSKLCTKCGKPLDLKNEKVSRREATSFVKFMVMPSKSHA